MVVFGLEGAGVVIAYVGSVLSSLLCVVYGILNWNRPAANEAREIQEEIKWEKEEVRIDENR